MVQDPYTVRHRIAEYFVADCSQVVDVGVYKCWLDVSGELYEIDPLNTVGGFVGSVADWWQKYNDMSGFGLVVLGMAVEGGEVDRAALLEMAKVASVVVVEWAKDYVNPLVSPEELLSGRDIVLTLDMELPMLDTPGYPVFNKRRMVVGR